MAGDDLSRRARALCDTMTRAVEAISSGVKGRDFCVLEDGDEMKGFAETAAEKDFHGAVEAFEGCAAAAPGLDSHPDLLATAVRALCDSAKAVEAYRARMFKYSTDHGSELSPAASSARRLLCWVRGRLAALPREEREEVWAGLHPAVRASSFQSCWFESWDRHSSERVSVASLFPGEIAERSG